jgi:hypothetical protein
MKHALGRCIPVPCDERLDLYIAVFDLAHDYVIRFETPQSFRIERDAESGSN